MRTTLTLEPDVALKLKKRMAEEKLTLKDAVNQALRSGLSNREKGKKIKFKVEPHASEFMPGIDQHKLNQLVDQLEMEDFLRKQRHK